MNAEALLLLISTGEELSNESFPSDTSCSVVLKKVFVSKESLTADWLIFHLLLLLVAGVGVLHWALHLVRYLNTRKDMITPQLRKRRRNPEIIRAFGQSISASTFCLSIICITDMFNKIFSWCVYFNKPFSVNILFTFAHLNTTNMVNTPL